MPSTPALPWRRIAAESVAIIASILVAFAIDAAWDSRQEAQQLQELLEGLRDEVVANQGLVMVYPDSTEFAITRLRRFRSGSAREWAQVQPADFYGEVYLPFVRDWAAPFQTGFLDATISSGKLSVIRDPETRASLTGLSTALRGLDRLAMELDRMGSDAAAVIGEYPLVRQTEDAGVETGREGMDMLRQDPRLQGLASARIIYFGGYWVHLVRTITPKLAEVVEHLDDDLSALR